MTYSETVDYLYAALPMFSRMGSAAYKKDLANTIHLCEAFGNPQKKFKSIHVGGTNGKGSVSHALAAIFQAAGYKTGLYTSPHLYDFRERIKLNGEMIPQEFVISFVENSKPLIERLEPSFFEITVVMAFQYFVEQQVDIAIIEVGLGGRLDSTNIITPELSIITNIGLDHTNILGTTLEEIAFEKAGIIKEGLPVVIGETLPETRSIFENVAIKNNADIHFAEEFLEVDSFEINTELLRINYRQKKNDHLYAETDLTGIYQVKNIRTVLTTIPVLKNLGWKLEVEKVLSALKNIKKSTGLMGRWEIIQQQPTVVLEVAHNKEGIEQMLLHTRQLSFSQLHIIIGTVKDKDVDQILKMLPANARYYFTQAHIPRALPASELQEKANSLKLAGEKFGDVNSALQGALQNASKEDLIIVCGSIFLIAEVIKPAT
ncbi:MAG: bifunctional folylpolyglutamate synthase/dihydrofolate synthase [Flavisolibacter sp.]|jgi:dihydrofolate synthase/folylpolyglutamate synthase|nr:bifunctional folylpolyglutamate synthase/dihydrofolate synthase [Flavisolibacter sp.]